MRVRDEEGVAAIVVVVSLFALFGAVAISIDAGSIWTRRRQLITGTDAAALAAARQVAVSDRSDCGGDWRETLASNDRSTAPASCRVRRLGRAGYAVVETREDAPLFFAPVVGTGRSTVASGTAARWFPAPDARGLRPFGICASHPDVIRWLGHVAAPTLVGEPGRIRLRRQDPGDPGHAACAGRGWDWLGYPGTDEDDLRRLLADGYDDPVGPFGCAPGATAAPCAVLDPSRSLLRRLDDDVDAMAGRRPRATLPVPIVEWVGPDQAQVVAIAGIELRRSRLDHDRPDQQTLVFHFRHVIVESSEEPLPSVDGGARGLALCWTDHLGAVVEDACGG